MRFSTSFKAVLLSCVAATAMAETVALGSAPESYQAGAKCNLLAFSTLIAEPASLSEEGIYSCNHAVVNSGLVNGIKTWSDPAAKVIWNMTIHFTDGSYASVAHENQRAKTGLTYGELSWDPKTTQIEYLAMETAPHLSGLRVYLTDGKKLCAGERTTCEENENDATIWSARVFVVAVSAMVTPKGIARMEFYYDHDWQASLKRA
ncbi:hypothetical protein M011DRAFT_487066 [Sporormia fimetaria CBS 119925]|uniref:Uncharacterized protein n=1 Tax=Sporormia fimetaria CBS 119925 TaxID=1340428 RepID=A0A6A6VAC5_9PLEO|nr:hypothetical protein M011DRAFT_487066 [Sporormia fimetaria CBS 119925]